jgi:uncharacterized protein (DUF362 family)
MERCSPGHSRPGSRPAEGPRLQPTAGPRISRRQALGWLAVGALTLPHWLTPRTAQAGGPGAETDLALIRNGEPAALTRRAMEALGGMKRFVPPGATVVIKPNIGWDRPPELGANTHPDVVAALVTLALEAGARRVRVMDHTCNEARRCYVRSGIEAAARQAGAEVIHLPEGRGTEMQIGGERITTWPVHREVIEADVRINVPVAKHHSLSRGSFGMKNWLGALDGRRNQLHQEIALSCVDLAAFFKPALTVLDATRVLLRNGPQGGDPDDVSHPRMLMAGTDPVAIEAFGASLLGLSAKELPQITRAEERGLGRAAWDRPSLTTVDLQA